MTRRLVIGLTGNIATGKSEVARILAELGATIIDADKVAHEAIRPGGPAYDDVVEAFGPEIAPSGAAIDRARLGAIVFRDPDAMRRLETIVHPVVKAEVGRRIAQSSGRAVVVEAIKLIESGMQRTCDELWVVTAPRAVQIARLVATRGLTEQEAALRVDAQAPQEEKAVQADRLIENDGNVQELTRMVEAAWALALANAVTIREARRGDLEDAAGAAAVLNRVIAERRYTAMAGYWTPEAEQAYIDSLGPRSELYLAETAGHVVGMQSIEPFADYPSAMDHVAIMGTLILAEYRGRGIGRRLARASLEFARQQGYEKAVIYVLADNPLGRAYYRGLGFEERGTLLRQTKIDGVYHDEVFMELHLWEGEAMSFRAWIARHPRLTAWAVLAVGMVVILVWAARNVGLLPGQWAALIVATILLAGLCVWIIGWEKEEEEPPAAGPAPETAGPPEPAAEISPETKEQEETPAED